MGGVEEKCLEELGKMQRSEGRGGRKGCVGRESSFKKGERIWRLTGGAILVELGNDENARPVPTEM